LDSAWHKSSALFSPSACVKQSITITSSKSFSLS
jgi:hypothetical protein